MRRVKSLALTLLGALVFVASASAQSTVTIQWSYAGTVYQSQAAAVAALQLASPQNSVLTVQSGIKTMANGTTEYIYSAPQPLTVGTQTIYWSPGGFFNSEPPAIQQGIWADTGTIAPQCGGGYGHLVSETPWAYTSDLYLPGYWNGPGFTRTYSISAIVFDLYSTPQCGAPTTTAVPGAYYLQPDACPVYYTMSGGVCVDTNTDFITATELTCQQHATLVGDPCDAASGEFTQTEVDYSGPALTLTRYYHSATLESFHGIGVGWTHTYAAQLIVSSGIPVGLLRPNGYHEALYSESGSTYESLSGSSIHVQASGSNWIAYLSDGSQEVYSSGGTLIELVSAGGAITTLKYTSGLLSSVVGPFGHTLTFTYNTSGTIATVTDPAGNMITYSYDGSGNLSSVQYPDGNTRTYQYTNTSYPNNLTGIVDESGTQFLTVTYDSNGRASSSQDAGGANSVSLVFGTTNATVTDGLGGTTVFGFSVTANYTPQLTSSSHNGLTTSYVVPSPSVDPQQRATQMTDPNGYITQYAYDSDHMTSSTQAYGTPRARTTSYQYLNTLSALPTLITEPLRKTSYTYYGGTNDIETKTLTDTTVSPNVSRTWTYTYNTYGQVLTVDGPRTDVSDVTTYTYYSCTSGAQCGQIDTVTNALGQVTTYNTYNAHGQPLTMTDPNGVVTTLTYDARQRLTSREVGTETTSYSYYATGLLETVTLPDGSTLTYTYDGAHRLTAMADGLSNSTQYTLDSMGNRIAEKTYDPGNTLHKTHTRVINTLNQLYQDVNAAGTAAVTTSYAYDNNGNLANSDAPLSRNTANQYDELNRLKQITDPASGVTQLTYDANDQVTSVVDPRSLSTTYINNGFGDVAQLVSPDSGITTSTYDSAGNLSTKTDARGAVGTYTYDALNRVTQIAYSDQTINFTYDAGSNGLGRLTGASDANHSMSWVYDAHGRVTGKSQTVASVTKSIGYGYSNDDQTSMVTPSGQTVTYGYTNHRITSLAVNGTTILNAVQYDPFGPPTGWTWGNGTTVSRTYDQDGNPQQIVTAGVTNAYSVDSASRITAIGDSGLASASFAYGYDALDRVTSGISGGVSGTFTYDPNGNLLTSAGSTSINATISPTSNRVSSVTGSVSRSYTYDAAGNVTYYTGAAFPVNQRGKTTGRTVSTGTSYYVYNALGQFINRTGVGGTLYLVYDEVGHIVGEYSPGGSLVWQETIWLGDIPVATLRPSGSSIAIYYVHTDHLGAPRKVTRPSDNALVWRWDPATFGTRESSSNQNPSGLGTFIYNLRFPGQFYLAEDSSYRDNGARRYDAFLGRYLESDPIGLNGGINTYAYADGNPISESDPLGLRPLTATEKCKLKPYIPQTDLDNADLHDGQVPWYLGKDFAGITRGNDIYFRPGVYDGTTAAGIGILGHELVHVGQYRNGMNWLTYLWSTRKGYMNSPYEKAAYALENTIVNDLTNNPGGGSCGCQQ